MKEGISLALQSAFESGEFTFAWLVAIHFSTPIYLTNHHHSINVGPNTYLPCRGEMKIPEFSSSMEDQKGSITITLPNTDRVFDALIQSEGFTDKWLNIGAYYWDKDGNDLGYLERWSGSTNMPTTNESQVKIKAASVYSIFERANGIKTTEASHAKMSPPDRDRTFWWAGKVRQFEVES